MLQLTAKTFHPAVFRAAVTGTTMAGTEISDLMDRTLGLGHAVGSVLLLAGFWQASSSGTAARAASSRQGWW
jgi:uncharacterized membrane-anchored protein